MCFQSLAINQALGLGTDYPFTCPPTAVQYLLGDLWLSYQDDACRYVTPLQVTQLTGFNTASGDKNLIITDANGVVIVNTAMATTRKVNAWGNHLLTLTWLSGEIALRCTMRLAPPPWAPAVTWAATINTTAVLDARTYQRLPRRVRAIIVGLDTFTATALSLKEGYNIGLTATPVKAADGGRITTQISISANPGDGLGTVAGCSDAAIAITTINATPPDGSGNFTIDADGCYRVQRPVEVISTNPREVKPHASGLTDEEAASALQIFNDCSPCCSCLDYVNVYEGIRGLFNAYTTLSDEVNTDVRLYDDNVNRWNAQAQCRAATILRLVLNAEKGGTLFVAGLACNHTACCAAPLVLRTTFEYFNSGSAVTASASVLCKESKRTGSDTSNVEAAYTPVLRWPVMDTYFAYANPQSTSKFRNRINIAPVGSANTMRVTLSVHIPNIVDASGNACPLPDPTTVIIPAPVRAIWNTNPPPYPVRALIQQVSPISSTAGCCA